MPALSATLLCSFVYPERLPPSTPVFNTSSGLSDEQAEIDSLQAELKKIQAEQVALPSLVAEVRDALDAEAAALDRQTERVEANAQTREKSVAGIKRTLQLYEHRLGLKFSPPLDGSDELLMVFMCLDPRDVSREFTVAIHVLEDTDRYEGEIKPACCVQKCRVEGALLHALGMMGLFRNMHTSGAVLCNWPHLILRYLQ